MQTGPFTFPCSESISDWNLCSSVERNLGDGWLLFYSLSAAPIALRYCVACVISPRYEEQEKLSSPKAVQGEKGKTRACIGSSNQLDTESVSDPVWFYLTVHRKLFFFSLHLPRLEFRACGGAKYLPLRCRQWLQQKHKSLEFGSWQVSRGEKNVTPLNIFNFEGPWKGALSSRGAFSTWQKVRWHMQPAGAKFNPLCTVTEQQPL